MNDSKEIVENEPGKSKPFGYPVSNSKFWIMSIASLGFWAVYWAYRNFKALEIKKLNHPKLYALLHAVFLNFSLHRLMTLTEIQAEKLNLHFKIPKIILAVVFFGLTVIERFFSRGIFTIELTCDFLKFLILFYIQRTILDINVKHLPHIAIENSYNWKEVLCVFIIISFTIFSAIVQSYPELLSLRSYINSNQHNHRWIYANQGDAAEISRKASVSKEISEFWEKFEREEDKINNVKNPTNCYQEAKKWMDEYLSAIDSDLSWSIVVNPQDETKSMLIIESEWDKGKQAIARDVLAAAPKRADWSFTNEAPPNGTINLLFSYEKNFSRPMPPITVSYELNEANLIDIKYQTKDAKDIEDRIGGFVKGAIGNNLSERWVKEIDVVEGEGKTEPVIAIPQMLKEVSKLKSDAIARLPNKRCWEMNHGEAQERAFQLARFYRTTRFYSERYSKFNEQFCFLRLPSTAVPEKTDKIELAKSLNRKLIETKNACVLSYDEDQHNKTIDYNLAVENVNKMIPVLRDFAAKRKLPESTYLMFHDSDLKYEWIAMYATTKEPNLD